MEIEKVLISIKNKVKHKISDKDKRASISALKFIFALIQAIMVAKKNFSIADLRRDVIAYTGVKICRSAFLDRIKTKFIVKKLYFVLETINAEFQSFTRKESINFLHKIGVTKIKAVDSSMVTLWDSLFLKFPGTFHHAAIKLHACIDLVSGSISWFNHTAGSTHDSQCFPSLRGAQKTLFIFDLGYWSYELLIRIAEKKAFFLSRIKKSATLKIEEIVKGVGKKHIGHDLLSLDFKRSRGKILEVLVNISSDNRKLMCRAIGFWNPVERSYHWYLTNLDCDPKYIHQLYKLRWQVELAFKACKSSINIDHMPTTDPYAVITLLLVGIINYQLSILISESNPNKEKKRMGLQDQFKELQRSPKFLYVRSQGISLTLQN